VGALPRQRGRRKIVAANALVKLDDDAPLDLMCLIGCAVQTGVGAVLNTAKVPPGATVLVEVDCSGDPGRGGAAPPEVPELVGALRRLELDVAGLMTVAPAGGGEPARRCFTTVGRLVGELGLAEASMGMSDDLELAVAAGSTMVRVGRALFGPRPGPAQVPQ